MITLMMIPPALLSELTETEYHEKRITAFELWSWRRVLRNSWTEYKTYVWVRQKIGVPEENRLLEKLKKLKLRMYN